MVVAMEVMVEMVVVPQVYTIPVVAAAVVDTVHQVMAVTEEQRQLVARVV